MRVYADHEFYVNEFGGSLIPEAQFLHLAERAACQVNTATMGRAYFSAGEVLEAVKRAVCALAEVLCDEEAGDAAARSAGGVVAKETVGSWSRSYAAGKEAAERFEARKREALETYLGGTGLLRAKAFWPKGERGCFHTW